MGGWKWISVERESKEMQRDFTWGSEVDSRRKRKWRNRKRLGWEVGSRFRGRAERVREREYIYKLI